MPVPADQLVTSFSSKSEIALNLSTNGQDVTFMGYVAPVGALDVSNSNTPGAFDPTNPVPSSYYRAVADVDSSGQSHFTETNAYSGNNGRAAILDNTGGANVIYTAGNAGNGGQPAADRGHPRARALRSSRRRRCRSRRRPRDRRRRSAASTSRSSG